MSKRNIFLQVSGICFLIFLVFFVLFLANKIRLFFVLCVLELFFILLTISCYLVLKNIKDDCVYIYKIRYIFLIILDFIILLAMLGVSSK